MMNFDDDDDDFTPKSGQSSKLANLFAVNDNIEDINESNKSLKYIPPKQPKKIEINSSSGSGNSNANALMTLIHASAVNVFKFENGKYISLGKLGTALIGIYESNTYKLIIYAAQKQHITYASIDENFKLISQANNYCSFYDDNRQNWSIMFSSEEEKSNFNKYFLNLKYYTKSINESTVLTQDLTIGSSDQIKTRSNDTVEVKYKGWGFEDRVSTGQLFVNHEKPFRIELEEKWAEILCDMSVNSKRYVIIPYKLREKYFEIMGNLSKEQVLIYGFELEIIRIKPRSSQKPEKQIIGRINNEIVDSKKHEPTQVVSNHDLDKDESEQKLKSDILSRVAKMGGLPILPMKQESLQSNDTTDAHDEDMLHTKPSPKPRNNSLTANISQIEGSNVSKIHESQSKVISHNSIANNQIPISMTTSHPIQSYLMPNTDTNLSILVNETRNSSTDIKMNLNKIIDKIDSISEKVCDIKNSNIAGYPTMSVSSMGFMDSAILLSSIQRIVNENNNLKKDLEDKTSKLQTLNEKICDLLQRQSQQNPCQQNSAHEIERLSINETKLKRELHEKNESNNDLKDKCNQLKIENKKLLKSVEQLESELENINLKKSSDEPNVSQTKQFKSQVKKIMNDVFRKLVSQFEVNQTYESEQIVEIVSNCIKSTTLAVIQSTNSNQTNSPFHPSIDEIDVNQKGEEFQVIKKPPISERKIIEAKDKLAENTDNHLINESTDQFGQTDIQNSKPKIPSTPPPNFDSIYEDSNED